MELPTTEGNSPVGENARPPVAYGKHNSHSQLSFLHLRNAGKVTQFTKQRLGQILCLGKRLALIVGYQGRLVLLSTVWALVVGRLTKKLLESILETCWGQLQHFISIYR
jgi:hypothetical protein